MIEIFEDLYASVLRKVRNKYPKLTYSSSPQFTVVGIFVKWKVTFSSLFCDYVIDS